MGLYPDEIFTLSQTLRYHAPPPPQISSISTIATLEALVVTVCPRATCNGLGYATVSLHGPSGLRTQKHSQGICSASPLSFINHISINGTNKGLLATETRNQNLYPFHVCFVLS